MPLRFIRCSRSSCSVACLSLNLRIASAFLCSKPEPLRGLAGKSLRLCLLRSRFLRVCAPIFPATLRLRGTHSSQYAPLSMSLAWKHELHVLTAICFPFGCSSPKPFHYGKARKQTNKPLRRNLSGLLAGNRVLRLRWGVVLKSLHRDGRQTSFP